MAGSKNAERDRRICLLRRNGFTFSEIAQMEDLSRVRVAQIVHEHNAELDEEAGRAEIASILEYAERKAVEVINDPGVMLGPNGKAAKDGDGNPVPNKGLVIEGIKTLVLVADKRSRLFGWDKQQQKQKMAEEAALAAAKASIEALAEAKAAKDREIEERHRRELEAARAVRPQVVAGEVVGRELPPAS